jgi:hypothetical protein
MAFNPAMLYVRNKIYNNTLVSSDVIICINTQSIILFQQTRFGIVLSVNAIYYAYVGQCLELALRVPVVRIAQRTPAGVVRSLT